MVWTKDRLEDMVRQRLGDLKVVVVANREPYIHTYDGDDDVRCIRPASGLTTALDPVMRVCGGVWVGHGSGDADWTVVDKRNRVAVPPEDPSYTLRRVWLTKPEEQGYYYGFSNQALWPLCHVSYTRPRFSLEDWEQYRRVNQKFADAILDEVEDEPALVFVQDYHFALLPRMLKNVRSDLVVAHFWHIPWPNPEVFRVCPWADEILDGLLGNDLLSFHIQYHCNNFLETVDRTLESRIDQEDFSVNRAGQTTIVRPHPISIDPDLVLATLPDDLDEAEYRLRRKLRLPHEQILVGVDRVDYTKGLPERFAAIDRLLTVYPELKGQFSFVQVGAPSRTHIPAYRQLNDKLEGLVEEINWRHSQGSWRPIVFLNEHFGSREVFTLYRIAAGCVVSSLHDGMNLVAKEFVAARYDLQGVLVLSRFTGASRELTDAVLVNPYAIDEMAEALHTALSMPSDEQQQRMARMREAVEDNNIYRWAGMLLSDASRLAGARQLIREAV